MTEQEAQCYVQKIKKDLLCKGIWFTITEVYEDGIKYIKGDFSIKIK